MITLTVYIIQGVGLNRRGLDVPVLEKIHTNLLTSMHIPRGGIGNQPTQKHASISPGLEVDNEIQTHWRRVPCSSEGATRLT